LQNRTEGAAVEGIICGKTRNTVSNLFG